eukprot:CAMPEP_0194397768 /NCGR_PEP_ID=MMETSP0174-20130528/125728_1 /TAXON_ID=216777 /ORGANISM="Proboscia alata, Strain PI-D3" /LENGTH=111 /DNA_ID=CAMNT_0039193983 /DNA_START=552 /DNA_END=887 /DNA_ORIENTATION=-
MVVKDQGNCITPSSHGAFVDSGNWLIGDGAKNNAMINHENKVFDAKCKVFHWKNNCDKSVQADKKFFTYIIVSNKDKSMVQVTMIGTTSSFAHEEVSVMILNKTRISQWCK